MNTSMNVKAKIIPCVVVLGAMLALGACSSDNRDAAQTPPAPNASDTGASTAPGKTPAAADSSGNKGASGSSGTAGTAAGSSETKEAAEAEKQLQELLKLAKQGKVPHIEYAAHTGLIDEVEKSWGKADKTDSAGKGLYATYSKKHAVFGFNKGSQIFDVRSDDPELQKLKLDQIEKTLGKPQDTKVNGEDMIYIYKANDQFQLKFIIPKSTGKVDHISVFSPQDSINNMAG
ncbi:YjgB family protein [Paenibacillus doosanensis]|nr:YjgB family protein [Paenibacillus doosanensis]MCS7464019.1 YjgB family protein [Paenibacillus doosanensis]